MRWWKIKEWVFKEVREKLDNVEKRKIGLSFSREKILKREMISDLWTLDLVLFYFILDLSKRVWYDIIYITAIITQSHDMEKAIEDSEIDNII